MSISLIKIATMTTGKMTAGAIAADMLKRTTTTTTKV
ncbi:hypothetical protein SAMN06265368_2841 [Cohaesibacter gelatinilyticus]|uniref:Uncharacterized protein n=1 Tax=Cohaesibacter gelatinilyticus TaxID=372072 RepID=A0A285PDG3_9HYPH|nr:hypothetical protein SAMN06265368_2841 [Cohaesibacter gelatinilyticus]